MARVTTSEPGAASTTMNRAQRRKERRRGATRVTAGLMAVTATAALGLGQTMGAGQAQAATIYPEVNNLVDFLGSASDASDALGAVITDLVNSGAGAIGDQWRTDLCSSLGAAGPVKGGADCSGSTGTGIAIVLPESLEVVPVGIYDPIQGFIARPGIQNIINSVINPIVVAFGGDRLPSELPNVPVAEGDATIIGNGFQFALASGGGQATAISYLPMSLATAGASDGRQAFSFALIGLANAWTTSDIPVTLLSHPTGVDIPGLEHVSCYGVVTAGYAQDVGACANVAGTFDFKLDLQQNLPELQFALTDPSAMIFDPSGVFTQVVTDLFAGNPLTLSKDFVRLGIGGDHTGAYGLPSVMRLTSDYGFTDEITIGWLGSTVTLFAKAADGSPNYFALPIVTLGSFDGDQFVPVVDVPDFALPFGLNSVRSEPAAAPVTLASQADGVEDDVDPEYVGRHRAPDATDQAATPDVEVHAEESDAPSSSDSPAPVVEQPVAQEPVVEQPTVEVPTVEQESADDSAADSPVADDPVTEDITADAGVDADVEEYVGKHRAADAA